MVFNRAGAAGVDGGVLGSHGGGDERELDLGLGFVGTRGERVEEREGSRCDLWGGHLTLGPREHAGSRCGVRPWRQWRALSPQGDGAPVLPVTEPVVPVDPVKTEMPFLFEQIGRAHV